MSENRTIDFTKLLGFQVMSEELAEHVDFQDETFGGRLGAKVGDKGCPTLFLDLGREANGG